MGGGPHPEETGIRLESGVVKALDMDNPRNSAILLFAEPGHLVTEQSRTSGWFCIIEQEFQRGIGFIPGYETSDTVKTALAKARALSKQVATQQPLKQKPQEITIPVSVSGNVTTASNTISNFITLKSVKTITLSKLVKECKSRIDVEADVSTNNRHLVVEYDTLTSEDDKLGVGQRIVQFLGHYITMYRDPSHANVYLANDAAAQETSPNLDVPMKQSSASVTSNTSPATSRPASAVSGRDEAQFPTADSRSNRAGSSFVYSTPMIHPAAGIGATPVLVPTRSDGQTALPFEPLVSVVKEARWNVLESFSKITRFTKETAAHLMESPLARPLVPLLPPEMQVMLRNETLKQTMDDYDSMRVYLAKWAQSLQTESARQQDEATRYNRVGIWGFADGWDDDDAVDVLAVLASDHEGIPTHTRQEPLNAEEWLRSFDSRTGQLSVGEPHIRESIFRGGVESDIRVEVWKFMLGVYTWEMDAEEREATRRSKVEQYWELKNEWFSSPELQSTDEFAEQKHRIEKDVHRTDRLVPIYEPEDMPNPNPNMVGGTNRNLESLKDILVTYNRYNPELGYVQGMSDLLAPLFEVMGDEAMAFWCFVGFMERVQGNFYRDQSGMHRQLTTLNELLQFMDPKLSKHLEKADSSNLFFCFRWLLVVFKREFPFEQVKRLWEILWSDYITDEFHLFVALAILDHHREVIMDHLIQFDEILKYINDLSMTINLEETLQRAEILFYQFRRRMQVVEEQRSDLAEQRQRVTGDMVAIQKIDAELQRLPRITEHLRRLDGRQGVNDNDQTKDDGLRKRA
ncbi:hypothetical protein BZG36_01763 [Bifiguratus adelaidae]|uniref:GTPase-activating protein GYP7 n=1 Tax=Bifiguratus adelaidae TaxID=1938954 RepID=A0A261Y2Y7_9FUNG|nr:hypothetical protein BZG36_01763 [Bifiguratus adelaidae]